MPLSLHNIPVPRRALAHAACLVIAVAGACPTPASAHPAPASQAAPARIVIKEFGFRPAALAVAPGTVVTVVNRDTVPHTVTALGPGAFDTGRIKPGSTKHFKAPRTRARYTYVCDIHPFMSGTLTVR